MLFSFHIILECTAQGWAPRHLMTIVELIQLTLYKLTLTLVLFI